MNLKMRTILPLWPHILEPLSGLGSYAAKVVQNYLIALALADVIHIYATHLRVGWDALIAVNKWNDWLCGNIGASTFLFVNRLACLLGIFGKTKASSFIDCAREVRHLFEDGTKRSAEPRVPLRPQTIPVTMIDLKRLACELPRILSGDRNQASLV
ncbi:uncharacterized protein CIMG_12880 [Coccidioides immitis RS]|uniref:DUF7704 domain-containing protein n=1 Tax=Coccidioides immitis (strain RS) TaxID=246410 RepID=A0A0D8JVM2_COCIM|nr:uncharacterized protein CIMG_12880 [Coccidioides immitis RS]KJF60328.1 hypothetical protein CIMG_12880 [Coccidioides immitis RS]